MTLPPALNNRKLPIISKLSSIYLSAKQLKFLETAVIVHTQDSTIRSEGLAGIGCRDSCQVTRVCDIGDGSRSVQTSLLVASPEILALEQSIETQRRYTLPLDYLACDIWSSGCLLVWMLGGYFAFIPISYEDCQKYQGKDSRSFVLARQQEWVSILC